MSNLLAFVSIYGAVLFAVYGAHWLTRKALGRWVCSKKGHDPGYEVGFPEFCMRCEGDSGWRPKQ